MPAPYSNHGREGGKPAEIILPVTQETERLSIKQSNPSCCTIYLEPGSSARLGCVDVQTGSIHLTLP